MYPAGLPAAALSFPAIDPVIFSIGPVFGYGPVSVHWYGAMYVVGILCGWLFAKKLVTTPDLWPPSGSPIRPVDLDDFLAWAVAGIVLGGRLGYVLFYNPSYYALHPLEIFSVWDGGMSFHGGAIGSIIAMILFARKHGFSAYSMLDVIAASSCFGIFFVRIANFINSELWGRVTDVPWAFVFPDGGPQPRHPSQLYEAGMEGALLFIVLAILIFKYHKLKTPGFIGGAWLCGYGLSRIVVEFFRQPDAHIGYLSGHWLTMGMVLSLPMLAVGLWGMLTAKNRVPWHNHHNQTESEPT